MAFNDGDFLEIEYTAWNDSDGSIIATTDEKLAKDSDAYNKDVKYGPTLVVLGSNAVVKGLERELKGMELNQKKSFVLEPSEAFGERVADLVKVMPLSQFKSQNISPYPGMRLNIDNVAVTVVSVGSGRVVVDANHPDAGKKIKYEVKVVKKLDSVDEKIKSLGKTYDVEPTKVESKGPEVELFYSDEVKKNADYFVNRASLVASILTYMKSLQKVYVREEYARHENAEEPHEHKESEKESE
ncbi:MAG: FKBP-type peptidyl-prolyl cis-trans isomerase [Candidatus Marsarchaeota archaeon]|nr:FKBP-type peptidyl-prolyl cis-trans isomerase [Candidatus Marsarchaeota archaeon]MCL5101886.1 FKBP-type peptidyl-prolyl cis-trans isomerase [Candidatus Marsarchaeota archaeon]